LNRAVTLATEAATGTVSQSQRQALNAEFSAIKSEIDRIGNATNFNGTAIFSSATVPDTNQLVGNAGSLTLTTALTNGDITSFTAGGKTFTFTAGAASTVGDLINAINDPGSDPAGLSAYIASSGPNAGQLVVIDPNNNGDVAVGSTMNETKLGLFNNPTGTGSSQTNIFLSDGAVSSTYNTISVNVGQLDSSHIGTVSLGTDALYDAAGDANSITAAKTALTDVNAAISQVASLRGGIGAGINRLQSATNVINNQVQNLTSAEDGITAADIPSAVANLTKYSILEQTGVSALAQSNQMQQLVLKLIQ
jgi:flagellin